MTNTSADTSESIRRALHAERALATAEYPSVYVRDRDGDKRRRLSPARRATLRTVLRLAVRGIAWAVLGARYRVSLTADVTEN